MQFFRDLNALLSRNQKRNLVFLQCYYLVSAFLQVAGVASVAPFIAVVSSPSMIHKVGLSQWVFDFFSFSSDRQFMIAFAWGLMGLIVIGNAVMAGNTWLTVSYAKRLGIELQSEVLKGYLNRDFERVGQTNSSRLIETFTQGIARFVYMVVQPLLYVNSSIFVVILIVCGLIWFDPFIAISASAIIGIGYFAVYALAKGLLERHGALAWSAAKARHRLLSECLGGFKEIKLMGCEAEYEERVDRVSRSTLRSQNVVALLAEMPRYALEAISFCALLGLGIVLLQRTQDPTNIVSLLSVYAMAGYRLLPAAQTIFKSAAQIRANADIVAELVPEVLEGRHMAPRTQTTRPLTNMPVGNIVFDNVWYAYPGSDNHAVKGASFTIRRNTVTAIVGSSGSGKSTIADLILGLLHQSKGHITIGGRSLDDDRTSWRQSMGYVAQSIYLLDDTVKANIAFDGQDRIDEVRVRAATSQANLDDFIATLPKAYDFVVGERGALLSGGQRQRVGIARALYRDAKTLILDEATSALDSVTEREIIETLGKLKQEKTVVMIAHRLSTIRNADLVLLIEDGRVKESGTYETLIRESASFRDLVAASDGVPSAT